MDRGEFQKAYGRIVAKAWADEDFKQRLLSDPTTVLKENGINVPEGVQFKVVESTGSLVHLILPAKPDSPDIVAANPEVRQAALLTPPCWYG